MRRSSIVLPAILAFFGIVILLSTAARAETAAAGAAPVFLSTTGDTCMGSSGAGGQGDDFGFSVGSTWTDSNCIMVSNAKEMKAQGYEKASKARLCMDDDNAMAFELANDPCPRALESSRRAAAAVKGKQTADAQHAQDTRDAQSAKPGVAVASTDIAAILPGIVAETAVSAPSTTLGSIKDFIVNVGNRVFFGFDKSSLTAKAKKTLDKQADWLTRHPATTAVIEGHTDARGSTAYNLALGERRAGAMRDYLVDKGVAKARIQIVSYGESRPAVAGDGEGAWSQNRRGVTYILDAAPEVEPVQLSSLSTAADVDSSASGAEETSDTVRTSLAQVGDTTDASADPLFETAE
ncbi:MAG: OmpA family protein [Alphaproteobacteria bacterium]|nr:OmpA family protein [Alphaproteobacteria bacterium]